MEILAALWKNIRQEWEPFQTQRAINKKGQVAIWLFSIQELQNYKENILTSVQKQERRHNRGQQMAAFVSFSGPRTGRRGPVSDARHRRLPAYKWNNRQTIICQKRGNERHNNKVAIIFKRFGQSSRGSSNPCVSGALQDNISSSSSAERQQSSSLRQNTQSSFLPLLSLSALAALIPPYTGFTYRTYVSALWPPVCFFSLFFLFDPSMKVREK